MTHRFWIGVVLSIPVLALAMSEMLSVVGHMLAGWTSLLIEAVLSTPVGLWGGAPFFARGWASIKQRSPNMFTLIALGIGVAWIYSIAVSLLAWLMPSAGRPPLPRVSPNDLRRTAGSWLRSEEISLDHG